MRELKFRFYDKEDKVMRYFTLDEMLERHFSYYGSYDLKVLREEKSQYTGLKDKNGKEIYEGDIILCNRNINDAFDKTTFEVKFSAQDGTYAESKRGNTVYAESFDLAEVIGNIYENPELLEGKYE